MSTKVFTLTIRSRKLDQDGVGKLVEMGTRLGQKD